MGRRLREVRLNVCAKSQSSAGLRRYVSLLLAGGRPAVPAALTVRGSRPNNKKKMGLLLSPLLSGVLSPLLFGALFAAVASGFKFVCLQVEQNYTDLKTLNPNLPFLVRAADDITPNIVATYGA